MKNCVQNRTRDLYSGLKQNRAAHAISCENLEANLRRKCEYHVIESRENHQKFKAPQASAAGRVVKGVPPLVYLIHAYRCISYINLYTKCTVSHTAHIAYIAHIAHTAR
jgi:hypothetical protein